MAFLPDGRLGVVAQPKNATGNERSLLVWNLPQKASDDDPQITVFHMPREATPRTNPSVMRRKGLRAKEPTETLHFAMNGARFAICSSGVGAVFNMGQPESIGQVPKLLALSPDGRRTAVKGADGLLHLWDVDGAAEIPPLGFLDWSNRSFKSVVLSTDWTRVVLDDGKLVRRLDA